MRADARGQPWWAPVGPAAGFALLAAAALDPKLLAAGGLSPVAVATVFALFVGLPLARRDHARSPAPAPAHARWARLPQPDPRLARGLVDVAVAGALGATAAGLLSAPGVAGAALGAVGGGAMLALGALLAWVQVGGPAPWLGRGLMGVAVLGVLGAWALLAVGLGLLGQGSWGMADAPWGALEPSFPSWRAWIGAAVGLGALASWVPGQWERAPAPAPRRSRAPALAVGIGLLALPLGAALLGAASEHAFVGDEGALWVARLPALGALTLAISATLGRGSSLGDGARWALGIGAAAGWFALAGPDGRGFWWAATLPALLGVACALRALGERDGVQGLAATVLLGGALASADLPAGMLAAGAAAVPAVVAVWVAGTRALLTQEAT